MAKVILKKYGTSDLVTLTATELDYEQFNTFSAGTYTDGEGRSWSVNRSVSYERTQLSFYCPDEHLSYEEIFGALNSMGLSCGYFGENLYDDLGVGDSGYLIAPDNEETAYPSFRFNSRNNTFGNWSYRYEGAFSLYENSQINLSVGDKYIDAVWTGGTYRYDPYGGVAAFNTTSGLGDIIFGYIIAVNTASGGGDDGTWIYIGADRNVNKNTFVEVETEPGEKGFRPTAARTTRFKPGNGGRGTSNSKNPAYAGDHIEQPGAPDESSASAVKSGFLNCYKMTQSELNKVCSCLYSDTLLDAIKQLMVNPLDFIVSLMIFPCSPDVGASEAIKFGKWSCVATGVIGALGTDMSGAKLSKQFKVYDFGTITVPENWGNFLDYSQTSVELYLPFIGSVQLDPSECMCGTVNVQYTVDFFTGQCVANVYCHKYITLPSGTPIDRVEGQHCYQGNCAVQIPLSAVNYGSMIGSLINACTGSITNPTQPFSVLTDAAGGGFRPSVTSKGNVVANSGFCAVLYPYIRLLRPITAEPDSYQEVMGLPSYINTTLGQCEDLCVCDGIDLKGISGATESELDRIRQLCSEGVYV